MVTHHRCPTTHRCRCCRQRRRCVNERTTAASPHEPKNLRLLSLSMEPPDGDAPEYPTRRRPSFAIVGQRVSHADTPAVHRRLATVRLAARTRPGVRGIGGRLSPPREPSGGLLRSIVRQRSRPVADPTRSRKVGVCSGVGLGGVPRFMLNARTKPCRDVGHGVDDAATHAAAASAHGHDQRRLLSTADDHVFGARRAVEVSPTPSAVAPHPQLSACMYRRGRGIPPAPSRDGTSQVLGLAQAR